MLQACQIFHISQRISYVLKLHLATYMQLDLQERNKINFFFLSIISLQKQACIILTFPLKSYFWLMRNWKKCKEKIKKIFSLERRYHLVLPLSLTCFLNSLLNLHRLLGRTNISCALTNQIRKAQVKIWCKVEYKKRTTKP